MGIGGLFHNKHNLGVVNSLGGGGGGVSVFSWCETDLILIVRIWLWTKNIKTILKKDLLSQISNFTIQSYSECLQLMKHENT